MNKRVVIASALGAAVAVAVAAPSFVSAQGGTTQATGVKLEKCYGIARAGQNDCSSAGNNTCAGTSKVDADPKAWLNILEGRCERIVGGSKTPKA